MFRRRKTLHKLCDDCFALAIDFILSGFESSQVAVLILEETILQSGVSLLNSHHKLSSSIFFLRFHYVTLFLCSYTCYNSIFLCVIVMFFHLAFGHGHLNGFLSFLSIFAMHHHYYLILIFLFDFENEPSHLLNQPLGPSSERKRKKKYGSQYHIRELRYDQNKSQCS